MNRLCPTSYSLVGVGGGVVGWLEGAAVSKGDKTIAAFENHSKGRGSLSPLRKTPAAGKEVNSLWEFQLESQL